MINDYKCGLIKMLVFVSLKHDFSFNEEHILINEEGM
jgi:hypothetical protein